MANNPGAKHPTKTHSVTMGKTLRQQIKAHIEKHRSDYEPFFAVMDTWTTVTEGGDVPQNFEDWLKSLLRETRWICLRASKLGRIAWESTLLFSLTMTKAKLCKFHAIEKSQSRCPLKLQRTSLPGCDPRWGLAKGMGPGSRHFESNSQSRRKN